MKSNLFSRIVDMFSSSAKSNAHKKGSTPRSAVLRLEALETRELLSVSPTQYEDLRNVYDQLSLPESLDDVNIIELTSLTAEALQEAIDSAKTTPQDDIVLLNESLFVENLLDLSESTITINVNPETSGLISILTLGKERAQIQTNKTDATFDVFAGNVQFGGIDFIGIEDDVSPYCLAISSALDEFNPILRAQNVGWFSASGQPLEDVDPRLGMIISSKDFSYDNTHDYALIFIGGYNAKNNYIRYYDTLLDFYSELTNEFSVSPSNIYILYADGDSTGASYNLNLGTYEYPDLTTSDLSFAVNAGSKIRSATSANLNSTLKEIAGKMNSDSHLLFYTYDHGSGEDAATTDYNDYLCGWNGMVSGASVRDSLFQIRQGYVTCVFGQCFSGGILDDIFDPTTGNVSSSYTGAAHFAGGAAANHYEPSWTWEYWSGGYGGYIQTFAEALRTYTITTDVFEYTEKNNPFTAEETYARNKGAYEYGVEHPWHAGESFSVFHTELTALAKPTISTTSSTTTSITVKWGAVSHATNYTVTYALAGSSNFTSKTYSGTSCTISGLTPGKTYEVKVRANGDWVSYQDSPFSAAANVSTKSLPALTTPTISSTSETSNTITVNWGAIANRSNYTLEYKKSSASSWSTWSKTITSTTATITGLDPGTAYSLRVKANGDGVNYSDSKYSAVKGATTKSVTETRSTVVTTLEDVVDGSDGLISLREAIEYAADGGTITFASALGNNKTITLNGTELTIKKSLTINGGTSRNFTISANNKSRVFNIASTASSVTFKGLTITGGSTTNFGGGVYCEGSNVTFTGCTIKGNVAKSAGGVDFRGSGLATFTDTVISENVVSSYGGSFRLYSGSAKFVGCTISNNQAGSDGGAVENVSAGNLTMTNCLVVKNKAGSNSIGGAFDLYSSNGVTTLYNCTVAYNEGGQSGVYVYGSSHSFKAYNTIITNNTNSKSADVYVGSGSANGYNSLSRFTNWTAGANNLTYSSSSPLFANAANGDFSLASGSQALNRGNNSYLPSGTTTDIQGGTRIVGSAVDLGAYEYQGATEPTPLAVPAISSTSSTSDSITVNWSAVAHASGYYVQYKLSGGSYVTQSTTSTSYTITGLDSDSAYVVRVRAKGDGTNYSNSNYSATSSVRTKPLDSMETPSTVVTTLSDVVNAYDGLISLREAIENYATDGSTITFAGSLGNNQTITLNGTELAVNKSIYINGGTIRNFTIDANDKSRVFNISSNVEYVRIKGLTIKGGSTTGLGGGIYTGANVNLTLTGCALTGNDASYGGGVYLNGDSSFINCTITGNSASFSGGGVNSNAGSLTLKNCTISSNAAESTGGGVTAWSGEWLIKNCSITENEANFGGGLYVYGESSGAVVGGVISNNTALRSGGGAYCSGGEATFSGVSITSNEAKWGGGAFVDGDNTLARQYTFKSCLISGNEASSTGGGIEQYEGGVASLMNCTVTSNTAGEIGGGVYRDGAIARSKGFMVLTNSILVGNKVNTTTSDYVNDDGGLVAASRTISTVSWGGDEENYLYSGTLPLFKSASGGNYQLAVNSIARSLGDEQVLSRTVDPSGFSRSDGADVGAYGVTSATAFSKPTVSSSATRTANSIKITWSSVANATGYQVIYAEDGSNDYSFATTTGTTFTATGLTAGKSYKFKVRVAGTSSKAPSVFSLERTFATTGGTTTLPTPNVSVSAKTTSTATVSWDAVTGASGYALIYKTPSDSEYTTVELSSTETSYKFTGLTAESKLYVRVRAKGNSPNSTTSDYSATLIVTPQVQLTTPTLTLANATDSSLKFTWTASPDASGYRIMYKGASDSAYTTLDYSESVTSATLTGLESGAKYAVKIAAIGDGFNTKSSAYTALGTYYTESSTTQLPSPTITTQETTSSSITIHWNAVEGATKYYVGYAPEGSASFTQKGVASTATSYTLSGLSAGETYQFKVRAVADGVTRSNSDWGAVVSATTSSGSATLSTPVASVSSKTTNSITLTWRGVSNASGYDLIYKEKSQPTSSYVHVNLASSATSYKIMGLDSASTYYIKVRALGDGVNYLTSDYCATISSNPLTQLATPTITNVSTTTSSLTLSWTAVPIASSYSIMYKASTDSSYTTISVASSKTLYKLTGLKSGATYQVKLAAIGDGDDYKSSAYTALAAYKTTGSSSALLALDDEWFDEETADELARFLLDDATL